MKILGIDYGDYSIGLAIYDDSIDFIYPLITIFRKKENIIRKSLVEIEKIIINENIKKIIIGLPLNMDGTKTGRVEKTIEFKNKLQKRIDENIPILFQDERLTTIEAEEILKMNNIKREDFKKNIDQVAATIILNDYKETITNGR